MKLNRVVLALTAAAVTIGSFAGCSMAYGDSSTTTPLVTQDAADSEAVLEKLRWADEITLKKKAMSFNDQYEVSADGEKVGEIQGQYIYTLGDTFSLFSTAGNLVASEGEAYRVVKHEAKLYNYNNEPAGRIQEEISFLLTRWTIYDANDEKLGQAEQNFSWTLNFDVKNAEGEPEYTISKAAFSIGAEMTIKRVANEPTVPVMNAVWLAAVANEIAEAEEAKNNDSK